MSDCVLCGAETGSGSTNLTMCPACSGQSTKVSSNDPDTLAMQATESIVSDRQGRSRPDATEREIADRGTQRQQGKAEKKRNSAANPATRSAATAWARGLKTSRTWTRRPGTRARPAAKAPGGLPGNSGLPAIPPRARRLPGWVRRMPVTRFWKTPPATTCTRPESASVPCIAPAAGERSWTDSGHRGLIQTMCPMPRFGG
jgi:hypothetical protein